MVSQVKVTGIRGTVKNMNRILEWANIKLPALSFDTAEKGKEYAVGIAPRKTGDLINAIGIAQDKSKGFAVVSRTPKGNNSRRRPYHEYMHGLGNYNTASKIKSGDPRYMFTTFDWLRKKFPEEVQKSLDKAMKK